MVFVLYLFCSLRYVKEIILYLLVLTLFERFLDVINIQPGVRFFLVKCLRAEKVLVLVEIAGGRS